MSELSGDLSGKPYHLAKGPCAVGDGELPRRVFLAYAPI
jgi:hypothetical protein